MVLNPDLSISIIEPMNINTPDILNQFDYDNRVKRQCVQLHNGLITIKKKLGIKI